MQAEPSQDWVRNELVAMLPRLKRFAEVLVGDADEGTALLSRALNVLLANAGRYRHGTPFDRWAFGEIYRFWLQELREHADPMRHSQRGPASFAALLKGGRRANPDDLTVSFLANLPPQQRSTILLVYGEGFTHEDAAIVLDCPADTIEARLIRASASLADKLDETIAAPHEAEIATLREQPNEIAHD